jgi:hypothetical protein
MSVETTGPIVELSFRWNPRDRDEIAEMGDHIARITGALAQAGVEASFVVLREAYQRPDGVPAVKALQKSMKVSKFSDVPLSRAGELFTACRGIAEKLNLRVPPPG